MGIQTNQKGQIGAGLGRAARPQSVVNKQMKEATEAGTQRNELSAVGTLRLQVVTDELDHVVEM